MLLQLSEEAFLKERMEKCMRLFQEENDSKETSSEQYNDYMKVTSVRIWLVLCAILFLLIGICMWIMLSTLETTMVVQASIHRRVVLAQIPSDKMDKVSKGMEMRCGKEKTTLSTIEKNGNIFEGKAFIDQEDCEHINCTIVLERIPVMSFFTGEEK